MTKVNGRRLNGEGSINKVSGRNLFRMRIRITRHDGTHRRIEVYGKTRTEVRKKVMDAKRQAEQGILVTRHETVAKYLERWHTTGNLRPKSIHSRLVNVNRMIPIIGELKLSELRASHIQSMYHALAEQLSDYSMRQVNAVLGKALKDAVKEGVLLFNPLDRLVSVPTARPKEMNSLTAEEAAKLLAVDNEWAPLFTVLVGTGLRIGEALGLTWTSIYCACGKPVNDEAHRGSEPECLLKMARLVVRRTLQRVPGQGLLFSEPKTEKSRRAIPLSAPVITALKKHLSRQAEQRLMIGADWSNQDLVFSNEWGNLMEPTRVNRALKRSLKLARITKHVRVHDLRHTAASLMVRHGVAPKAVQETLGHSTYATTMDVYVHADEEMLENAVNILGKAISGVA